MKSLTSNFSSTFLFICLMLSASFMFYFGYKTFYIQTEGTKKEDYTYHIALIAEELDHDYWRYIEQGAIEVATENDIYLEYVAPRKADNDEFLALFDRMISTKVDGIIVQGIEGDEFIELVHKSAENGIPIVTIDSDVPNSERNAYVGTDDIYAGELLGRAIIEQTKGPQYVGIIAGRLDSINQNERIKGFKNMIAHDHRLEIVAIEESNLTEFGAAEATYHLLKEHPEITALVGISSLDGIGIVEGWQDIAPNKNIYIGAFDILPETLDLIHQGLIDTTIAQYPEEMGRRAIEVMIDLKNNIVPKHKIYTDTQIVHEQDLHQLTKTGESM